MTPYDGSRAALPTDYVLVDDRLLQTFYRHDFLSDHQRNVAAFLCATSQANADRLAKILREEGLAGLRVFLDANAGIV